MKAELVSENSPLKDKSKDSKEFLTRVAQIFIACTSLNYNISLVEQEFLGR